MAQLLDCVGTLVDNADGTYSCTGDLLLVTTTDIVAELATYGITPESILLVYSWGAGAVLTLWAIGFAVRAAVDTIKTL